MAQSIRRSRPAAPGVTRKRARAAEFDAPTVARRCARLAEVLHRRWAAPILATLHREQGAKFVTLVHRLGLSRDSLRATLRELTERGWVMRNPGYGHPIRPEYILTSAGARLAPACASLVDHLRAADLLDHGLRKWSMPALAAVAAGAVRFSQLRRLLPDITPRALAIALKDLIDAGLIERDVAPSYPPATRYRPTSGGRALARVLQEF